MPGIFISLPKTKAIKNIDEKWTFWDMLEAWLNIIIFFGIPIIVFVLMIFAIILVGIDI